MWNERLFFDRNIDFVRLFDYNMKCYEFTGISFGEFYEIFIGERNVGALGECARATQQLYIRCSTADACLLWEQDTAGSNPVTRITFLNKCLFRWFFCVFSSVFVVWTIAVQRWFKGQKSGGSMSEDSC